MDQEQTNSFKIFLDSSLPDFDEIRDLDYCRLYSFSLFTRDLDNFLVDICLLKVINRNTRARCEICLKLTIKTPHRCYWCRSSVFSVNFGHNSHLVLVFLCFSVSKLRNQAYD